MNTANKLTVLRIFLAFICMGLILRFDLTSLIFGFIVFMLASLTDLLDGYIARKQKTVSDLGKILDPVADKILVIGIFLAFLEKGLVNSWLVIIIMVREFFITGLRLSALRQNRVMEAKYFGKHKTLTQSIAIMLIFILVIIERVTSGMGTWPWFGAFRSTTIFLTMAYVAALTVLSGIIYLWRNRTVVKSL
ncbi:CDP-diacylglycerol--glycerol-3-phosphate 3-phosphatidyltransferase [Candidatus Omnitrophota bacterium]